MGMYNNFKTAILLALLTATLLWAGSFFGQTGFIFAAVFVVGMNFVSYFYSDKIVLKMYKAKEVNEGNERKLYMICKKLSIKTGLPMPKVYVIPDRNANAFATGRNKNHSAVAATRGILDLLNDEELEGVMAHEFAHIKNRDILISTVAGMLAGIISYMATMAQWSLIFGGGDEDSGSLLQLLFLIILTPLIATIIQLSISRSREYLADQTGAKFAGTGKSLASALEKLESQGKMNPMRIGNEATAHLFISNPFSGAGKRFLGLLSTHPPMEERVRRLREMRI